MTVKIRSSGFVQSYNFAVDMRIRFALLRLDWLSGVSGS